MSGSSSLEERRSGIAQEISALDEVADAMSRHGFADE